MTPEQVNFKVQVEAALQAIGVDLLTYQIEKSLPTWTFTWGEGGNCWPLKLAPNGWSLTPLPYLNWDRPIPIWGWPHIGADGSICIMDREGLDYDPDDIGGIVTSLVKRSAAMLAQNHALSETERMESFADELEAYAHHLSIPKLPLGQPLDPAKGIYAEVNATNAKGRTPPILRVHSGQLDNPRHSNVGLQLIDIDITQLPALRRSQSKAWWQDFVSRLSEVQRQKVQAPKSHGVVLRVQNRYGGALMLLYWGRQERSQYRDVYTLNPAYHNYLTQRVGGKSLPMRMAVVGVGAVGSRVAEHLTLAGVQYLTLVDHDEMTVHNLGRHVLDQRDVGKKKATALAERLGQRMPGVSILPVVAYLDDWLNAERAAELDVLVLASGDSPSERAVIRRAWRENWPCKIISVFVEAGGLGGHAISMQAGEPGCLECLYVVEDSPPARLSVALLEPSQQISVELNGCGAFTPYSAMDATRTALLAVELALATEGPSYSRWVGPGLQAQQRDLRPSPVWYALRESRIKSALTKEDYRRQGCPCCGG